MAKLISISAYAKRRGVTPQAVRKAANSGRISLVHGQVDAKRADREWTRNTWPAGHGGQNAGTRRPRQAKSRSDGGQEGVTFSSARARREHALADLAELELARKRGDLVSLAEIKAEVFAYNRRARDMLLAIPDRLAPRLVGLDEVEAHKVIGEEIHHVCHAIADAALAADAPSNTPTRSKLADGL